MPSALVLVANGTEEMELSVVLIRSTLFALIQTSFTSTIVYDTLIRAGVKCTSALISPSDQLGDDQSQSATAQCSRGIRIVPDVLQSQLGASSVVCLFPSIL